MLLVILATVFSGAAARLLNKVGTHRVSIYAVILIQNIGGAIVTITWIAHNSIADFSITNNLILPLILSIGIWRVAGWASFIGIRHTEASVRESLIQSRLIFIPLFAALVLGEAISWYAALGTALVLFGILVVVYRPSLSLAHPDMHGIKYVLLASFLVAVASTIDKYMVERMDYLLYALLIYLAQIVLLSLALNKERLRELTGLFSHINGPVVLVGALVSGVFYLLQLWLFQHLPLHIAYPIIQVSSALTILLAIIFLRERDRATYKILGFLVAALGAYILKTAL